MEWSGYKRKKEETGMEWLHEDQRGSREEIESVKVRLNGVELEEVRAFRYLEF